MRHSTESPREASGLRWIRRLAGALTICVSLSLLSVLVPARSRDAANRTPRASTAGVSTGSRNHGGCEISLRVTQAVSHADSALTIDSAGSAPDGDATGPGATRDSGRFAAAGPVHVAVCEFFNAIVSSLPRGRAPPRPA